MLLQLDLVAKVRQTRFVLRDPQTVFLDVGMELDPPKLVGRSGIVHCARPSIR
jgi:hypothetical protein